jgi:hypothetical protein
MPLEGRVVGGVLHWIEQRDFCAISEMSINSSNVCLEHHCVSLSQKLRSFSFSKVLSKDEAFPNPSTSHFQVPFIHRNR